MRKKLVVGNWKMNGSRLQNAALLAEIVEAGPFACDVVVCVPFPYLGETAVALVNSEVRWGGQDCSSHVQGAFTGEVSAGMLAEFGCRYVLVGHSERRMLHGESDQLVAEKACAALSSGLTPIVCVGESLAQREQGLALEVVKHQLAVVIQALGSDASKIVVAYEPVWAIGTGVIASPDQAQEMHALIRMQLRATTESAEAVPLLYGGSLKPENAVALFTQPDIDGGLIGGAALKAADFTAICRTAG